MHSDDSREIGCEMKRLLSNSPASLRDIMEHLQNSRGKMLRGCLALICAEAASVPAGPRAQARRRKKLVTLAAVIEILHMATLVHDDVIDDAETRRGLQSVQSRFGRKAAVMAGDYLFTVCFEAIAGSDREQMRLLSRATSKICAGEILQNRHNFNIDLTFKQYLGIIIRKTGVLFGCAAAAGAKAGGADERTARDLGVFATYLGIIFQIIDDCLDYSGSEDNMKKPVLADLRSGVVTLPAIFMLSRSESTRQLLSGGELSEAAITVIRQKIRETGALEQSVEIARRYHEKAKARLDRVTGFPRKEELYGMLDRALSRVG